jgi:hypothetical protein
MTWTDFHNLDMREWEAFRRGSMTVEEFCMTSLTEIADQPPHPRTRTIKPFCAICGQPFYPGESMVVEYWRTDEERFLHEKCAETKKGIR